MKRRTILRSAVGATIVGLAGCSGTLSGDDETDDDPPDRSTERIEGAWSMADRDSASTRRVVADGIRSEPTVEWDRTVSGRVNGDLVLSDSLVYANASLDGSVHVLEAGTGERYLEYGDLYAVETLAVDDGTVYAVHVEDEKFTAYERRERERRWERPVTGAPFEPTIDDGTVYVQTADIPDPSGSAAYAFDSSDGTERWRIETAGLPRGIVLGPDTVWATTEDEIVARSRGEGRTRWTESVSAGPARRATGVDDRLVFAHGAAVSAIDEAGEVLWTSDEFDDPVTSLAAGDGVVYAGTGSETAAIRVDAGAIDWRVDVDASVATTITDDVLYAGGYGRIVGLEREGGATAWELPLDEPLSVGPIACEGTLFVATQARAEGEPESTIYALARS